MNNGDNFERDYDYDPLNLWNDAPVLDLNKEKRVFSRIGFGLASFSLVSLAVSLIIQLIVLFVNPDFASTSLFLNLVTPVSLYLFALPVMLIIIGGLDAKAPEKRKMGFGQWLLILLISFGLMYIGSFVGNYVMDIASAIAGYDYSNMLESVVDGENLWVTAIFVVIVAPVGEEIVFRKLLIDRTQKYGCFISVMLSGLAFGLMHANFYQFFYAFALGLVLGYVYYNTGKLHLTIALHAPINFVGSIVSSWLTSGTEKMMEALETMDMSDPSASVNFLVEHGGAMAAMLLFEFFVFGAMICAIVLPIVLRRKINIGKGEIEIPRGRKFEVVVRNAGIIVMLAVYVFEFALNMLPI